MRGSDCGDDERGCLRSRVRPKAVLKWVRDGVIPSRSGGPGGITPGKFRKFYVKMGHIWAKIEHFSVNAVDGA